MKEIDLPSGAKLKIDMATFTASRALYQSFLEEMRGMKWNPSDEIDVNLFKDLFCSALSSKKVEACLWECMKKALYNDLRITLDTFEPVEAREDYLRVCLEVAHYNVGPFMKNLFAELLNLYSTFAKSPELK